MGSSFFPRWAFRILNSPSSGPYQRHGWHPELSFCIDSCSNLLKKRLVIDITLRRFSKLQQANKMPPHIWHIPSNRGTTGVGFPAAMLTARKAKEFWTCGIPHWSIPQEHATYSDFPGFLAVAVLHHHLQGAEVHTWYLEPWIAGYQSPLLSPVHTEKRICNHLLYTLLSMNLEMGQSKWTTKTKAAEKMLCLIKLPDKTKKFKDRIRFSKNFSKLYISKLDLLTCQNFFKFHSINIISDSTGFKILVRCYKELPEKEKKWTATGNHTLKICEEACDL